MHRSYLIATLWVIAACGKDTPGEPASITDRFPRLSHAQWEATVQDLFHLPAPSGLSTTFQPDPQLGRFDNNIARLGMSAGLCDDELFAAAKAGTLDSADGVTAQAARVLDDPRAAAQFRRFHFQAYSIAEYADLDKDKVAFPDWRRDIGGMMEEETLRFVDGVIASDGGVAELLLSTKAYVNADL